MRLSDLLDLLALLAALAALAKFAPLWVSLLVIVAIKATISFILRGASTQKKQV